MWRRPSQTFKTGTGDTVTKEEFLKEYKALVERNEPALSGRGGLVRYLQRLSGTEPFSCWRQWPGLNTLTARGLGKGVVRERKAERTPSGVATRRKATADRLAVRESNQAR